MIVAIITKNQYLKFKFICQAEVKVYRAIKPTIPCLRLLIIDDDRLNLNHQLQSVKNDRE